MVILVKVSPMALVVKIIDVVKMKAVAAIVGKR